MRHVYGPVPSRRLGRSLGIDPIPLKTCNWNCVYCQLGRTRPLTLERKDYFPPQDILDEVAMALADCQSGDIDWVTFVGSGEPTLHASIGWMIRQIKELTDVPVAVITNGSLLYLPGVRHALSAADAVLPTLDAGSSARYRKINRPHPDHRLCQLIDGLVSFRAVYKGKLWPEVMLVRGLNDTKEALLDLAMAFHKIKPDRIHLNIPSRPPVETWVQPPTREGLMRAAAILGDVAQVVQPAQGEFGRDPTEDLVGAVIQIITRHPMCQAELESTLAEWAPGMVDSALRELRRSGRAQVVDRLGTRFWSASASYYPEQAQNLGTEPEFLVRLER